MPIKSIASLYQARPCFDAAGSGGDSAAATNFLARTFGLDATHTNAYKALLNGLTADGLFNSDGTSSYFDALYVYATADTTTALLSLIDATFNSSVVGAPSFAADGGYTGADGSITLAIDTTFDPTTASSPKFIQNSAHISVWSNTSAAAGASGGIMIGNTIGGADQTNIFPRYSDGNAYFRVNDAVATAGTANGDAKGHYVANRSGASANQGFKDGSLFATVNGTSSAPFNAKILVLASNQGTGIAANPIFGSGAQIMSASIGGDLTGKVSAFYGRLHTYLQTIAGIP